MNRFPTLIIPGLNGSGTQHWQTLWEHKQPNFHRVHQKDWDYPDLELWITELEKAVTGFGPQSILVAHSLGCALVAHWAMQTQLEVKGALLVAPPDVWREGFPQEAKSFSPMPLDPLPFKSIVVASTNDPFATIERAQHFADCWQSKLVNVGNKKHINAESNLEDWPEGFKLLSRFSLGHTK
jgi:predicted alpha/beta hydrolase family esterase